MALLNQLIHLIRLPNLIIVLITQATVYFGLISPALKRNNIDAEIGITGFVLITLITMITAIGGYIINDILDIKTDQANDKTHKMIGDSLDLRAARILYILLFITGFVLCFIYTWQHNAQKLIFIYPAAFALLAFYSWSLKKTPLLGNLTVAGFSAAVVGILLIFEYAPLKQLFLVHPLSYSAVMIVIKAFILFAFVSSLLREIIKDIEDHEGDKELGMKTTSVFFGKDTSRKIALIIALILFITIIYWLFNPINSLSIWLPVSGALIAVYIGSIIYLIFKAREKADYSFLSGSVKKLMGLGLLFLILYAIVL